MAQNFRIPKTLTKKRRERVATVLDLRKQGLTYDEIAERTGASKTSVYEDFRIGIHFAIKEPAEEVLQLELARLDTMFKSAFEIATHEIITRPDTGDIEINSDQQLRAIDRVLRIMERRDVLLGISGQPQVDHSDDVRTALTGFLTNLQAAVNETPNE